MIVATHGYPALLVQDLRIPPGTGILGSVFATGTPLRVEDVERFPLGHRRRARYRTNSFLVVPVRAGDETLGVLSLSDRLDDQPYTRDDASALRALMAPTALALSREAARRDARRFLHAATIDPVSGLFNRRYFHVRLGEELERAQRHGMSVALLMLDIDDFKCINDEFGHVAGDMVIRDISEILRHSVRVFDVCTRYGGDEFAIVMPGIGSDNAASIAERIRHRLDMYEPQAAEFMRLRVTASIGLAVSTGVAARELVDRADRALYHAKSSGKNRVIRAASMMATPSDGDTISR
jgi:diguanylate cyclase (GGDEF)-like protein